MSKFYGFEKVGKLERVSNSVVHLLAGSYIKIGGQAYSLNQTIQCDFLTSGAGGIDNGIISINSVYYVYAIVDSGIIKLISSTNIENPANFNSNRYVGAVQTDNLGNILMVSQGEDFDTDWEDYTPDFDALGTVTNVFARYRRMGQDIEVYGRVTAGTPAGDSAKIGLPSVLLIDQTNVPSGSLVIVGKAARGAGTADQFHILTGDGETNKVLFSRMSVGGLSTVGGTALLSASGSLSFNFSVPISNWSVKMGRKV